MMDFCSTFGRSVLPIFGLIDEFVWGDMGPPLLGQTAAIHPTSSLSIQARQEHSNAGPFAVIRRRQVEMRGFQFARKLRLRLVVSKIGTKREAIEKTPQGTWWKS